MEIKDLFTDYIDGLPADKDPKKRLEHWFEHMANHPLVRRACIEDYEEAGLDWRQVALEKVFSRHDDWLERMKTAHRHLQVIIPETLAVLPERTKLPRTEGVTYLYHGLGNGAGWVREIDARPAMLFGIEKIAELGWHEEARIESLVAHEYTHLTHAASRGMSPAAFNELAETNALFRLYAEGVATYVENLFHGRRKTAERWFAACTKKTAVLKERFLGSLQAEGTEAFYGDWHEVEGLHDVGYFLGLIFVEGLLEEMSFLDLARLETAHVEKAVRKFLKT